MPASILPSSTSESWPITSICDRSGIEATVRPGQAASPTWNLRSSRQFSATTRIPVRGAIRESEPRVLSADSISRAAFSPAILRTSRSDFADTSKTSSSSRAFCSAASARLSAICFSCQSCISRSSAGTDASIRAFSAAILADSSACFFSSLSAARAASRLARSIWLWMSLSFFSSIPCTIALLSNSTTRSPSRTTKPSSASHLICTCHASERGVARSSERTARSSPVSRNTSSADPARTETSSPLPAAAIGAGGAEDEREAVEAAGAPQAVAMRAALPITAAAAPSFFLMESISLDRWRRPARGPSPPWSYTLEAESLSMGREAPRLVEKWGGTAPSAE